MVVGDRHGFLTLLFTWSDQCYVVDPKFECHIRSCPHNHTSIIKHITLHIVTDIKEQKSDSGMWDGWPGPSAFGLGPLAFGLWPGALGTGAGGHGYP